MTSYPNPVVASAEVHELLNDLHRRSEEQEATINPGHSKFVSVDTFGDSEDRTPASSRPDFREKMSDKFIALDQDKCQFMYQLMRSTGALNVVEAGTSFGGNHLAVPQCETNRIGAWYLPDMPRGSC